MTSRPFPTVAAAVLLLAAVVVFFPTLFFGRVVSPLDVVFNDPPWRAGHHPVEVANPALRQPATAFLPAAAELQREGSSSAIWSPYAACGGAGTLEWSRGLLSPFVLPFISWIGWPFLCNAMILGKLGCAFVGMYLLLRRLRRSPVAAAGGAIAYALSGPLAARWLWPVSGAAALLPLLLWTVDRALADRRPARAAATTALAGLAFLSCGSPAATVVGAVATAIWVGARRTGVDRRDRPHARGGLAAIAIGLVLASAILAPSLGLFLVSPAQDAAPAPIASEGAWGWSILRLLVDPFAFGDPRRDSFEPPASAGPVRFHDSCIAVGMVTAALVLLGTASRRPPWLWLAVASATLFVLAWAPAGRAVRAVPGLGEDPWALAPLGMLALAVLAAVGIDRLGPLAGAPRRAALLLLLPAAIALEQGLAAGHLLTFLPCDESSWSCSEGLARLQSQVAAAPARIAPLQDVLWPNTAAAYGFEDLRSNLGVGDGYRRWLQVVDPQVWGHFDRSLRLNAATIDLRHPYLAALGARWVLEPPQLRLVEYVLSQQTVEVEPRSHLLGPLRLGDVVVQELKLESGCRRLAVHASTRGKPVKGRLEARLTDEVTGDEVAARNLSAADLADEGSAWLDLPRPALAGRRHRLELVSHITSGPLWLRTTNSPADIDGRLTWNDRGRPRDLGLSFDLSGYSISYEGDDLRVWENARAAPRFWPVRSVVEGDLDDVLTADPPLDPTRQAIVSPPQAARVAAALAAAHPSGPERIVLESWGPASWVLSLDLEAPALLASSVRAQPSVWRATIDGARHEPVLVNGLFLGVLVPEGRHILKLRAGLSPLWYGCTLMGTLGLLALATLAWRREPASGRPPSGLRRRDP